MRKLAWVLLAVVSVLTVLAVLVVSWLASTEVVTREALAGRMVQAVSILMGAVVFLGLVLAIRRRAVRWIVAFVLAVLVAICVPVTAAAIQVLLPSPGGSIRSASPLSLLLTSSGSLLVGLLGLAYSVHGSRATATEARP